MNHPYSPSVEYVLRKAASSAEWLQAPSPPWLVRGEAVDPAKGELRPVAQHPQSSEETSILIEGNPETLALIIELAKKLGARVDPTKVPRRIRRSEVCDS